MSSNLPFHYVKASYIELNPRHRIRHSHGNDNPLQFSFQLFFFLGEEAAQCEAVILVADTAVGHRGVCECAGRRDGTQPSRLQGRCGFEGAPWLT